MAHKTTYQYRPKIKIINAYGGDIVPTTIKSITKKFDYHSNFMAYYTVVATIPNKCFEPIRSCIDSILVVMSIEELTFDNSEGNISPTSEKMLFSDTYLPFFDPSTFTEGVSGMEEDINRNNPSAGSGSAESTASREVMFTLYNLDCIKSNKKILNAIVANKSKDEGIDVGSGIGYIMSNSPFKSMIIDKPDNTEKYDQIIIPPRNIAGAIRDLQNHYGIYSTGVTQFFDDPVYYLLNRYMDKHEMSADQWELTTLEITKPISVGGMSGVTTVENDAKSIKVSAFSNIERLDNHVYMSELMGKSMNYVNYGLALGAIARDSDKMTFSPPISKDMMGASSHASTGDKEVYEYDETNNVYNIGAILARNSHQRGVIVSGIEGVKYDIFKPNTIIMLKIAKDENSNIANRGLYTIAKGEIALAVSNTQTGWHSCVLRNLIMFKVDED